MPGGKDPGPSIKKDASDDDLFIYGDLSEIPSRSDEEVRAMYDELWNRVWYYRKIIYAANHNGGQFEQISIPGMVKCEEQYPDLSRDMYLTDNEWGLLQGKLSALAWAMGSDWEGSLDT